MAAMRVYRAPNGLTYQYPEGKQPEGYVPADARPKAAPKRRTAQNKAAKPADK